MLQDRGTGVGSSGAWQPTYMSDEFVQAVSCGGDDPDEFGAGGDPQIVDLFHRYLVLGQREWDEHRFSYRASFAVTRINASRRDVLFLTGVADNGEAVIERWLVSSSIGPDGHVERDVPPSIAREQVYRGTSLGVIREIGPDPEGRFVLALCSVSAQSVLWQVDLGPGRALTKVLDAAQEALLERADGMYVAQHQSEGRMWVLESLRGTSRIILNDADNDGAFENWASFPSAADWEARGYEADVWLDDFHGD